MKSNIFQYGVISIIKFNATRFLEYIEHRYIAIYLIRTLRRKRLRPGWGALSSSWVHVLAESERRGGKIGAFHLAVCLDFSITRDVSSA